MSYSNTFQGVSRPQSVAARDMLFEKQLKFSDYLRDLPMEIGRRFYPPPTVNLPILTLPHPLKDVQYAFTAEKRARQQYDEANAPPQAKPEPPPRTHVNGVPSTESTSSSASMTNDVLQPCAPPPASKSVPKPQQPAMKDVSFAEFEGRGTVFDELEWSAIDDKEALSQILGNVSLGRPESTSSVSSLPVAAESGLKPLHSLTNGGKSATLSSIPPYPVLDFSFSRSRSEEPAVTLSATGVVGRAVFSKPVNSVPPPVNHITHSTTARHDSPLRVRLLTKGYRENLVSVAMEKMPRERLPHIEYYMKGMSILEKKGVDVAMTVKFLLDSNLIDKQAVVKRAHTAEQLIGMGFTADQVFPALLKSEGDRVKALDTLLGSR